MRALVALLLAAAALAGGLVVWLQLESMPPYAELTTELRSLGRNPALEIEAAAGPQGLRRVAVQIRPEATPEAPILIYSEDFPPVSWRGSRLRRTSLSIEPDLADLGVPEGAAVLEIDVETYAWHIIPRGDAATLALPIEVDLTPPRVEVLSSGHSIRLGGADVMVFRQSPDTVDSGVAVEGYFFPASTGYFQDPNAALALFAVPQDLDTSARVRVVARDAAGNEREVRVPAIVRARNFRERTLTISDNFLQRKVPEIEADNGMPQSADLLQGYLEINRNLRQRNEEQIRSICRTTATEPLWSGGFLRQARAASVSNFGDRRAYEYQGEIVDRQVHLGFDLASVRQAPVIATETGVVVFADNLGIYGQTVILDHGLGLFSLYSHLSSITASVGDTVERGASLGRTGETGLAGGDHLHYSIMIHGIHVDPVEWWDERWVENQISSKLALLPRRGGEPN